MNAHVEPDQHVCLHLERPEHRGKRGNSSLDFLDPDGNPKEIPIVLVKMDDNIGFSICSTIPNVIPFGEMCDDRIKYKNDFHRWQLPLRAASATTTHKMQGSTVHGNCVTFATNLSEHTPFTRGIDYVCHSRAKDLSSLFHVFALRPEHFTIFGADRKKVTAEYNRLRVLLNKE